MALMLPITEVFSVYEGDKPARTGPGGALHNTPTEKGGAWESCHFRTYAEAVAYAHDWLGDYSPGLDELYNSLKPNSRDSDYSISRKWIYNGMDYITIRRRSIRQIVE